MLRTTKSKWLPWIRESASSAVRATSTKNPLPVRVVCKVWRSNASALTTSKTGSRCGPAHLRIYSLFRIIRDVRPLKFHEYRKVEAVLDLAEVRRKACHD